MSKRAMVGIGILATIMLLLVLGGCTWFNEAPIAGISASPLTGKAPLTVTFRSTSTDDGTIVTTDWDFGDGAVSYEENPVHTYTTMGFFTVTLRVTDDCGKITTTHQSIEVTNPGPLCDGIEYRNASGCSDCNKPYCTDQAIIFDAQRPRHPVDGKYIVSYNWNFGDGSSGSGNFASHVYNWPGIYTVTLTLTDNDGVSNIRETTIAIQECCNHCMPGISIHVSGCYEVGCQMELCAQPGNGYQHGCRELASALTAKSVTSPEDYCGHDPCDCPGSCNDCGCRDGQWEWHISFVPSCGSSCEEIYYGSCVYFTPMQTGSYRIDLYYTCNGESVSTSESFHITE